MACGKFTHYRRNVSPGPLHSAGRVQLWEESKKHASSLPSTAPENKNVLACGFRRALDGGMVAYKVREIGEAIEVNVSWVRCAVMHAETIIYRGGLRAGVARGLHVYVGIADDQGLARGNSELLQDFVRAKWVRLLRFKTVAAINHAKIFCESQGIQDAHADAFRLVGKDGHGHVVQLRESFRHSGIRAGVVHFVLFVIAKKKLQPVL